LANLPLSDDATEAWYAGKQYYDFKGHTYNKKLKTLIDKTTKTADETKKMNTQKTSCDAFTRMVWKSTTTVAFGIKGRWVYARYCKVEGNKGGV
jgi:hypothetical protein